MLTACGRIVHLGICCAVIGTAALATDGYRVILRDGSYIQALEKPVVENGIAKVRIGGGLFTAIPEGRIDWRRSDAASNEDLFTGSHASAAPARPQATRAVGSGVFTLIGEPAPASAPAEGGGAAPAAAPAAAAPDPGAEIRERIAALNDELDELQQAKLDVEDQIRKTIKLEEIPDLRRRVDQLDAEIKSKRGEISGLILRETAPRP
jgi:hypothetical protein